MATYAGGRRRTGRRTVAALLLFSLMGCYRTTSLETMVPAPGTRIVADVSPVAAEELAQLIGPDATGLEGHVVRWNETEAELALLRVDHRGGRGVQWNQEHVVFPDAALRNIQERTLDTGRTALFVGGLATVTTILAVVFLRSVGISGGNGSGGGPDPVH